MENKKELVKKNPRCYYKKEYCDMLIEHMSNGFSLESFAGVVSVGKSTVYVWKDKYPEFKEAFEVGNSKGLLYFEKLGSAMMRGTLRDKDGNQLKHDTAIFIFKMKNRFKWSDRPQEIGAELPTGTQTIHDYIESLHRKRGENDNTI